MNIGLIKVISSSIYEVHEGTHTNKVVRGPLGLLFYDYS